MALPFILGLAVGAGAVIAFSNKDKIKDNIQYKNEYGGKIMSENIEKAVPTEESPKTKESETSAPAATDNVVLYPVSDEEKTVSAAQETSDTESKATDGKTADNTNKFSDTQNTKESSPKDAEEEEDDDDDEDEDED